MSVNVNVVTAGVQVVGITKFIAPIGVPWNPQSPTRGPENLAEFAGRACYAAWHRRNPATAERADYIKHVIEAGHMSLLEHVSVSLWLTGISRSCSHELVRHRHATYSQRSQRFIKEAADGSIDVVMPPAIRRLHSKQADDAFRAGAADAYLKYTELQRLLDEADTKGKARNEAARAALPNCLATEMVMTCNVRAWRHVLLMRGSAAADVEIRELALQILFRLRSVVPEMMPDIVTRKVDGEFIIVKEGPGGEQ